MPTRRFSFDYDVEEDVTARMLRALSSFRPQVLEARARERGMLPERLLEVARGIGAPPTEAEAGVALLCLEIDPDFVARNVLSSCRSRLENYIRPLSLALEAAQTPGGPAPDLPASYPVFQDEHRYQYEDGGDQLRLTTFPFPAVLVRHFVTSGLGPEILNTHRSFTRTVPASWHERGARDFVYVTPTPALEPDALVRQLRRDKRYDPALPVFLEASEYDESVHFLFNAFRANSVGIRASEDNPFRRPLRGCTLLPVINAQIDLPECYVISSGCDYLVMPVRSIADFLARRAANEWLRGFRTSCYANALGSDAEGWNAIRELSRQEDEPSAEAVVRAPLFVVDDAMPASSTTFAVGAMPDLTGF